MKILLRKCQILHLALKLYNNTVTTKGGDLEHLLNKTRKEVGQRKGCILKARLAYVYSIARRDKSYLQNWKPKIVSMALRIHSKINFRGLYSKLLNVVSVK